MFLRFLVSKPFSKVIFESNKLLSRILFKDFVFHPETKQLETNPILGVGNGHALSRDLHLLIPILIFLRSVGCRSILDLGSGDGFVLRAAKKIGFQTIIGIEADPSLYTLSKNNVQDAQVINCFFQKMDSSLLPEKLDAVYFFNPCDYQTMVETIFRLQNIKIKFIFTKNFNFLLKDISDIGVSALWNLGPYRMYRYRGKRVDK